MDRREEILNREHRKFVEDEGLSSIHTKNFPQAYKLQAFAAMDEYMKECCLELLEYMAKNSVDCLDGGINNPDNKKSFYLKGEWITKEQLFENFI